MTTTVASEEKPQARNVSSGRIKPYSLPIFFICACIVSIIHNNKPAFATQSRRHSILLAISLFQAFDAFINWGTGWDARFDSLKSALGLIWVRTADEHDIVEFDSGKFWISNVGTVTVDPRFQGGCALRRGGLQRRFELWGHTFNAIG